MAHFGASSHTWRSVMPMIAPPQTMARMATWAQPVSARPATAV